MKLARYFVWASAIAALSATPAEVAAQTFTLDPPSTTLGAIPATAGDLLRPPAGTVPAELPLTLYWRTEPGMIVAKMWPR